MSLVHYAGTVAAVIWVVLCLWDADDPSEYAFLGAAFGWGFLIEWLSMLVFEGYHYALEDFALAVGTVPLQIMLAWAAILYTGWQTGRYLGIGPRRLPFFVTLYAVHVDVAIDAVAADVPYWVWENGGEWFATPINNYVGWFTVTLVFVASFVALGRYYDSEWRRGLAALPASSVLFLLGLSAYGLLTGPSRTVQTVAFLGMLAVSLVIVVTGDARPWRTSLPLAAVTVTVHLFFAALGWIEGTYARYPNLVAVAAGMFALGLALHAYPAWYVRRQTGSPTAGHSSD